MNGKSLQCLVQGNLIVPQLDFDMQLSSGLLWIVIALVDKMCYVYHLKGLIIAKCR